MEGESLIQGDKNKTFSPLRRWNRWNALSLATGMTFILLSIWFNIPFPESVDLNTLIDEYDQVNGRPPNAGSLTISTGFPFNYHRTVVLPDATLGRRHVSTYAFAINLILCGIAALAATELANRSKGTPILHLMAYLLAIAVLLAVGRLLPTLTYSYVLPVLYWCAPIALFVWMLYSRFKQSRTMR